MVSLPKLSENFLAVKEKNKVVVRLHDMNTLQVIRKIKLSLDDNFFEIQDEDSDNETEDANSSPTNKEEKKVIGAQCAMQQLKASLLLKTIQ